MPPSEDEPAEPAAELRRATSALRVRTAPLVSGDPVGLIAKGGVFRVFERGGVDGICDEVGWGRVSSDGWSCLDGSDATDEDPVVLPVPLAFDPPRTDEASAYQSTRTYTRDSDEALMPFVFGKRWLGWTAPEYDSVEDFLAGKRNASRGYTTWVFEAVVPTEKGDLLRSIRGRFVPVDDVYLYPVSRFGGIELEERPPLDGTVPAWAVATRGLEVRDAPTSDAPVVWSAPFHTPLWATVPDPDAPAGWQHVSDPEGIQVGGWVRPTDGLRRWVDAPPPEGVEDAIWVDVDTDQQVLALRRGSLVQYVTLVSTGRGSDATPPGVYEAMDKAGWWTMASLPGSDRPYRLENVPWVVHFYPRYALHAAFWHDRFGHVQSHGCVNLAPKDAQRVFEAVGPVMPAGWWRVDQREDNRGSVVRIRKGTAAVPDRRR